MAAKIEIYFRDAAAYVAYLGRGEEHRILNPVKLSLEKKQANQGKLSEEMNNEKDYEARTETRIQELETQVEKGKNSEVVMHNSLVAQTDKLEQTKLLLQESRLEIASLQQKIQKLESSPKHIESRSAIPKSGVEESHQLSSVKKELKLAIEAEEYSKRAMDDLALVLKEVTTEANQVKEKLNETESELKHHKEEANEAKIEIKRHENTIKRLRLEAEESLLAWNGRETGFVDCVKRAEDEKAVLQDENIRLQEMFHEAEMKSKQSKEENNKLRDILKQAINESTIAKEAASIAQDENSQLKDSLKEKDEQLNILAREIECLKDNEAAAFENIQELKKMIFEASAVQENAQGEVRGRKLNKKLSKAFSFNLKDLRMHNKQKDADKESTEDVYSNEGSDPLKGSIFDLPSPIDAEPQHSPDESTLSDNAEIIPSDDLETSRRRKLLRKFSNIFIGRSLYRKEPPSTSDGILHK